MKDITNEWLKAAKDDLDTIKEIIEEEHLTNIVAFHAQQCAEKSLKALLEENEIPFVKIHSLETLIGKLKDKIDFGTNTELSRSIEKEIILKLDKLYIESRYPGDLGLLPSGKPSIDEANEFYVFAKNIFYGIKNNLT